MKIIKESISEEISYRRGYRHGYSQAMDDSPQGAMNHLFSFFNNKLMPWSYFKDSKSRKGETMVLPPESAENKTVEELI